MHEIGDRKAIPGAKVRRRLCRLLAGGLGALALLGLIVGNWFCGVLFCVLSTTCAVAAAPRCGWVIPCLSLGLVLGMFLDPLIKGGTAESAMWETVHYLSSGAAFGLSVGVALDFLLASCCD